MSPQPKRVRPVSMSDANLDDLLGYAEPAPSAPPAVRSKRWVGASALQAFIASAVVYTGFHILNLAPPYPLILVVCVGVVLVRRAVSMLREPEWQRTMDAVKPWRHRPPEYGSGGDGMLDAVRRWDRRLDWGSSAVERFDITVASRLGELADERLRLHHGVTRASDPERARALLGEQVWTLLHQRKTRVPGAREVADAVSKLESL